ncbi:MAG: PHP domain-containing protein [Patescibacteria group bacterium]
MNNEEIAKLLRNVAAALSIKDERKYYFQITAYQKAADYIENTPGKLQDYYKENRLQDVSGIGVSIKGHLEELFKTGKAKQFDWALEGIPGQVFTLMDIPTFGPKKSYRLVTEFNLSGSRNILSDLNKIARKGLIAPLKGFGIKSENDIIRAIKEFKEGKGKTTRMTLPFASEIADGIITYLYKNPHVGNACVLGSLRRRLPTVGDIDIAVASDKPKEVIDHFVSYPYKERIIEKGKETSSMLVSGGKQVDLMVQPAKNFGALLQHFTGSKNHNIALREYALRKEMSLSEHGIKFLNKKVSTNKDLDTEEKFYKILGLAWIPPELRENSGEIELSANNKLPKLISVEDIKGDFHLHSNFSIEPSHDLGKNTIGEMSEKARKLGYSHIGMSEHNPSMSRHTSSEIYELVKKRNEKIGQILSSNKSVRILKLLEIDILPSGMLAVDNKTLDILDFALVSVHSSFSMNATDMTQRIIDGLSHPKAKVLSHPTGRLLNQRPGYEVEWDRLLEYCQKNNKALEINAWPTRLDIYDTIIRQAVNNSIKMIINTDSHAVEQMDNMKYGVDMARRGWAQKDDILNTLDYNKLLEWADK